MRGFCGACLYNGSHWRYVGDEGGHFLWECPCCHTVRSSSTPYLGPTPAEPTLDLPEEAIS